MLREDGSGWYRVRIHWLSYLLGQYDLQKLEAQRSQRPIKGCRFNVDWVYIVFRSCDVYPS